MPKELKFCQSIEPPPPAQSSCDGCGDSDVRSLRDPLPARAIEGAAGEGAAKATLPSEAALQPMEKGSGRRRQ